MKKYHSEVAFFFSPLKRDLRFFLKHHLLLRPLRPRKYASTNMFPRQFNWVMVALNSVSVLSNARSLKCVLNTFNTDVTLFRILSLDGIISLVFSFLSAITHGLSATGVLAEGKIKCSLMLMTTMPAYVNGILCSLMISVIR